MNRRIRKAKGWARYYWLVASYVVFAADREAFAPAYWRVTAKVSP